jgi:hypothetical protein
MPEPKFQGITFTKEKIWSKNTGRTASGKMVGDVIAIKTKMEITFPPLSGEQVMKLDAALEPAFIEVYFKDPRKNAYTTKTFYAGTPSYPVYSYAKKLPEYVGVAVDLVEQ